MKRSNTAIALSAAALALSLQVPAHAIIDLDVPDWSVAYLIDQSETVLGYPQAQWPRDARGLAVFTASSGSTFLYVGYNTNDDDGVGPWVDGGGEVRKIDLGTLSIVGGKYQMNNDYTAATTARLPGHRGKAIAVDDIGRVYLAEPNGVSVWDADLSINLFNVPAAAGANPTAIEGVSVYRDPQSNQLLLYTADRNNSTLNRFELTESAGAITAATQAGLGGTGQLAITDGTTNLRNVEVDPNSGNVWVADMGNGRILRVDPNTAAITGSTVDLPQTFDIGFDGDQVLISQYNQLKITILNTADMSHKSAIDLPMVAGSLFIDPDGQSGGGAFAGIAVIPGVGVFVNNEQGQTSNEMSAYGVTTDSFFDDNDPILFAHAPEPASLALLGMGALVLASRRRRV